MDIKDQNGCALKARHYRLRSKEGAYYGADKAQGRDAYEFPSAAHAGQFAARFQKDDWLLVGHYPGAAQVHYALPDGGAGGSISPAGLHEIPASAADGIKFAAAKAAQRRAKPALLVR